MGHWSIDINCDVGEGMGNEALLFPHISSCNVACGGHAGDSQSMSKVVALAKEHQIKVGAHPSYPDKKNFGRKVMAISEGALENSIHDQLRDFETVLSKENVPLNHVKAHGALYNETAKNPDLAHAYLNILKSYGLKVPLYVPFGSQMDTLAPDYGFEVRHEAFGDRNYNKDLSLVSRKLPNALIEQPEAVLDHVLYIIKNGKIVTLSGESTPMESQTICIHGDTPSAYQILMYLSQELPKHGVSIQK
nr:5-oxoprolinase subunit PxpA [Allomuricauda sp.]